MDGKQARKNEQKKRWEKEVGKKNMEIKRSNQASKDRETEKNYMHWIKHHRIYILYQLTTASIPGIDYSGFSAIHAQIFRLLLKISVQRNK